MTMHADQLSVPVETVRRLIADQFPQWAALPVVPAFAGTVNALFRIGTAHRTFPFVSSWR